MITLPHFHLLSKLKNQAVSYLFDHTIWITVISLVTFSAIAIVVKNHVPSKVTTERNVALVQHAATPTPPRPTLENPTPTINDVLGDSNETGSSDISYDNVWTMPTPFPTFPPIPIPTFFLDTTASTTNTSSTSSCAGKATDANSQVYLSSHSAQVGTPVTVSIELRDCNNNLASNDNLKITQQTNDSTARVNGQTLPITIQAQNGKATFTVSSQATGTDTFVITDTNQNFTVTEPGYHNPSITFGNNSSGNAHCTSVGGEPNSWYSDVYPASPVAASTGSTVTFAVIIRDCNQNPVSSDSVSVSVSSGDSGTQINGGPNHTTFLVQNGQGNFTVTSAVTGTVALTVTDITHSFPVTDTKSHDPSVVFTGSSAPAPTPTPTSTDTPTPTSTEITTPTPTPTPIPTTPTLTPAPTSSS